MKIAAIAVLALCVGVACAAPFSYWSAEQEAQVLGNTRHIWAPSIEMISEPVLHADGSTPLPTVIVHGMGDAGTNPGMKSICATVPKKYPGTFVLCSTTADGMASITMTMPDQLKALQAEIAQHPELKNGFNAVGLSQGNFLLEAYISLVNNPPVRNFVSICGPLEGEATCPENLAFELICPIWKLNPYGAHLAFSGYWKNTKDQAGFKTKSPLLADVLNARDQKNANVTAHWKSLNQVLLVEATKDTMIVPRESEQMGMWQWGTSGSSAPITPFRESEGYKGDWMGWKTLDEQGKIKMTSFEGEHIRFSSEFWDENVLPLLG